MGGKKKKEKKEASSRVDGAQGGSGTSLEAPQSSSQGPLKQEDDASGEVPAQYTLARVPGRDVGRELIEVNVSLPGIACALLCPLFFSQAVSLKEIPLLDPQYSSPFSAADGSTC